MAKSSSASWDPIWEQIFSQQQWGKYPPEELIRFVARHYYQYPNRREVSFLELGCGGGACLWYLAREGFEATGIDGSESALRQAAKLSKADNLSVNLILGDVVQLPSLLQERQFDVIIDIACLQHNRFSEVESILRLVYNHLVPGGRFFSAMVSCGTIHESLGREVEPGTFVDIKSGPLQNRGLTHFFTLEEIERLFKVFESVEIDQVNRTSGNGVFHYNQWISSGQKQKH